MSRDGRVAYFQIVRRLAAAVWMMRDDGTARAPLVAGLEAWNPQWDPDGRRVLVESWADVRTGRSPGWMSPPAA